MICAYIDESGSTSLNYPKSESPLYVCVAVIIDECKVEESLKQLNAIAKELIQGAPFKHSSIGNDHKKRKKILEEVCKLDFRYFAQIVHKDKLNMYLGLKYRDSFYKFINRKLYNLILKNSCQSLKIITVDGYGSDDYLEGTKEYFNKNIEDLFRNTQLEYEKAANNRLIQVADLIAGTLNYYCHKFKKTSEADEWKMLLTPKEVGIEMVPFAFLYNEIPLSQYNDDLNTRIYTSLQKNIDAVIIGLDSSSNENEQKQLFVLKKLYLKRKKDTSAQSIFSDGLITDLKDEFLEEQPMSKQAFTSDIIGGLRRRKIIIAGTNSGYKLALSLEDIEAYIDHDQTIIGPMLSKLIIAKRLIHEATGYDILSSSKYQLFAKIIETIDNTNLENLLSTDIDDETIESGL